MARVFTRPLLPYANTPKPQDSRYRILASSDPSKPPSAQMLDADCDYMIDSMELLSADIDAVVAGAIPGAEDPNNAGKLLTTDGNDPANLTWIQAGSNQIANGAVTQTQIANGAVSTAQLQNGCITLDKMSAGSVGTAQILSGSISISRMAAGSVGTAQILSGSIVNSRLTVGCVGTTNIMNGAVTQTQIANGAVGFPQLQPSLQTSVFWGRGMWVQGAFSPGLSLNVTTIGHPGEGTYVVTFSNPTNRIYRVIPSPTLDFDDGPGGYILMPTYQSPTQFTLNNVLLTGNPDTLVCSLATSDISDFMVDIVFLQ